MAVIIRWVLQLGSMMGLMMMAGDETNVQVNPSQGTVTTVDDEGNVNTRPATVSDLSLVGKLLYVAVGIGIGIGVFFIIKWIRKKIKK